MTTLLDLPEPPTVAEPRIGKRAVGRRLIEARLRMGGVWKSREDAAQNLNVDVQSLRAWERGRWLPGTGERGC